MACSFSYPLISRTSHNPLSSKYSSVITRSTAKKYFGNINPLGKIINIEGKDFKISGITEDAPFNSHLKYDILLSFNTLINEEFCWGCNNNNTYIQVIPGVKREAIEAKLPIIVQKLHNINKDGFKRAYFLQPLLDIHLNSDLRSEFEENGSSGTVNYLLVISIIILILAWINYMNLSTARSITRAKEVGIRKVVGAGSRSLIYQFLIESFITNIIAIFISILIIELTSSYWIELTGIPVSFSFWNNADILTVLVIITFFSPLIAGFYPALVLSSYLPVMVLKGSFKNSVKGVFLRKGLVVFQFAISIILLVIIIVFNFQMSFMRDKDLGLNIKQKLVVSTPSNIKTSGDLTGAYNVFLNELRNKSLIENATFTSAIPGMENSDVSGGVRIGGQSIEKGKQVYFNYTALNYFDFFNIQLLCGRKFLESDSKENNDNKRSLIINESAVKVLGFKSNTNALGYAIWQDEKVVGNIVGVIKDYHQQSLDKEIKPVIIECAVRGSYFILDINMKNISKKIEKIKSDFTAAFPGNPFENYFLDEYFDRQYKTGIQTTKIFGVFTSLAIFISCLGLLGLSSVMITYRTKEIGIRKALGASISSLLALLSGEFIKWLIISNIIAWPIAYYLMKKWLEDFAYRIEISWWMFVVSGGAALVIAAATVSIQAVKAAIKNPVESLKYE
jgi:putative ABC transport system permease protein